MPLYRLLPLLLFSSAFVSADQAEIKPFQHSVVPGKGALKFQLEMTLEEEEYNSSIAEDAELSEVVPSAQQQHFTHSSSIPQLEANGISITLTPQQNVFEIGDSFLDRSSVEFIKKPNPTTAYSIIPWRIVKDISVSTTATDRSYFTKPPSPSKEGASIDHMQDTHYFVFFDDGKIFVQQFELFQDNPNLTPYLYGVHSPSSRIIYKTDSYHPRFDQETGPVPFESAKQLEETAHARAIQQKMEHESAIDYPECVQVNHSLSSKITNECEQFTTPDTSHPSPPLTRNRSSAYSYPPMKGQTPFSELNADKAIAQRHTPKKEPLSLDKPTNGPTHMVIKNDAMYKLPVGESEVIYTAKNPYVFYEKKMHSFDPGIVSFPAPPEVGAEALFEERFAHASGARREHAKLSPKKTFLFVDVPTGKNHQKLATRKVEVPVYSGKTKPTYRQEMAYRFGATFETLDLDYELFLTAQTIENDSLHPATEDFAFSPISSDSTMPLSGFSGHHPLHFLLDQEGGYVGCTYDYHPPKTTYELDGMVQFYAQMDALNIPFTGFQGVNTYVASDIEIEEDFFNTGVIPSVHTERVTHTIAFDPKEAQISVYTPSVSTGAPKVEGIEGDQLPIPDTSFLSNALIDDGLAETHALEEIGYMLDFGQNLSKVFTSFFPTHLTGANISKIPTMVNIKHGIPGLKQYGMTVSYGIDESKHINDGYRLTSYNLTRLPTPEELNIDDYIDSLSTRIEVAPRKDGQGYYFALTLQPQLEEELTKTSQNVVFLIDRTSSILAPRYDAYRNGVIRALQYLNEGDTFNIIVVDSKLNYFEEHPVTVTRATIRRARRFLHDLPFSKVKNTRVDLYDLLYELPDFFDENENVNTAILVSDGLSLLNMENKADTLRKILKRNQGNVTLHCATAGGKNNSAMLDLLSAFHSGELVFSHSVASFPRKLARLIKKTNALLSSNVHVTTVNQDHSLDVEFFTTNERMPQLYSGKPFTIYGSISRLTDFKLVIQGKVGSRFMHFAKDISFASAQKSPPDFYKFVSINKAYACYDLFLKQRDPSYLKEAKGLLQKYKLPAATKKKAPINNKRLMRDRLDIF